MQKHVAIIGAGIVGVSTAIWLQRAGCKVTIIDPKGPAGGASYGNAGVLAAIAVVPVTTPSLWKVGPKMVANAKSPLFMRWSYLPKLIPFLVKYLGNANDKDTLRIATGLTDLLHDTADQHVSLAKGTPAERYLKTGDYMFGYASREAYEADSYGWAIRKNLGYEFHPMDADELATYDPALASRFGYAVRCPNHGHISDPPAYVKALAAHVKEQGGTMLKASAKDIVVENGKAKAVVTNQGAIEADEVVLATGMWSGPLAEKLGIKLPMEAERGYHIEFVNPSIKPKVATMVASGKFVMTPMEGRMRCAGIVEFGGMTEERSKAPLDLLKEQTLSLIPELEYDRIDEWMGFRPSTTDSLPLVGATPAASNVWTGFGHQHIGLSGGPKTGRWLAGLIAGPKPNLDLSAFSPLRFNQRRKLFSGLD